MFIKADLETGGKLLFVCQYIQNTKKQSYHSLKQVKTYLRLLRKAVIQVRANSIGKGLTQTKKSYGYNLKT